MLGRVQAGLEIPSGKNSGAGTAQAFDDLQRNEWFVLDNEDELPGETT